MSVAVKTKCRTIVSTPLKKKATLVRCMCLVVSCIALQKPRSALIEMHTYERLFEKENSLAPNFSQAGVCLWICGDGLHGHDGFVDACLQVTQVLHVQQSQHLGGMVQHSVSSVKA